MALPDFPASDVTFAAGLNGDPYDASGNPEGLAQGGHRQNFPSALNGLARIANWISAAVTYIGTTAAQVASDAASAAAGSGTEASIEAIRSGVAAFYLSIRRSYDAMTPAVLADGPTIAWDMGAGINFDVTIGATGRTLANPTNKVANKNGILAIIQGTGGSKSITTWGSDFVWFGDQPIWPTTAGTVSLVTYYVRPSGAIWLNYGGNNG